jgi:hypothetical protein
MSTAPHGILSIYNLIILHSEKFTHKKTVVSSDSIRRHKNATPLLYNLRTTD